MPYEGSEHVQWTGGWPAPCRVAIACTWAWRQKCGAAATTSTVERVGDLSATAAAATRLMMAATCAQDGMVGGGMVVLKDKGPTTTG